MERSQAPRARSIRASTERALRDAAEALIAGNPAKTDGRLTLANLAVEAGVSVSRVYDYPEVYAHWKMRVGATRDGKDKDGGETAEIQRRYADVKHAKYKEINLLSRQRDMLLDRVLAYSRVASECRKALEAERALRMQLELELSELKKMVGKDKVTLLALR